MKMNRADIGARQRHRAGGIDHSGNFTTSGPRVVGNVAGRDERKPKACERGVHTRGR